MQNEPSHSDLLQEIHAMHETLKPICAEIKAIRDMIAAWKTVQILGRFVVWVGSLAVAIAAIVIIMKG